MIKNKLYEYLKKYIADYLFGFDKSQLEIAILSGSINLKDVNFKPEKLNAIFASQELPFQIKAGMIGTLKVKYNLLSLLSHPFDLEIDELQIILGPTMRHVSNGEEGILLTLQVVIEPTSNPMLLYPVNKDETTAFFKNARITINGIHIRYEDDYFSQHHPFAFGFQCDKLVSSISTTEWNFGSLDVFTFTRITPKDTPLIRETTLIGGKVYWKSMSEMVIPTSLWQETKHSPRRIFDAISLEDLRGLMKTDFNQEYLVDPFSCYSSCVLPSGKSLASAGRPKVALEIMFTKLNINLRPEVVENICAFVEYMKNIRIAEKLKDYKTLTRPITVVTKGEKKERKLVVKDWLFLAVWAERLKKEIERTPTTIKKMQEEQWFMGIRVRTRFQSINGRLFLKARHKEKPVLEILTTNLACEVHSSSAKLDFRMLFQSFYLFEHLWDTGSRVDYGVYDKKISETKVAETEFDEYKKINNVPKKPVYGSPKKPPLPKLHSGETPRLSVPVLPSKISPRESYIESKQRCIFSIVFPKDSRTTHPAFLLNLTSTYSPKRAINLRSEIADISIELFPQMLKGICALILDYREMYWFRHLKPIYEYTTKLPSVPQEETKLAQYVDSYLNEISLNVSIKHAESNISFYEDKLNEKSALIKQQPFFVFTTPASTLSLLCDKDFIKTSIFGFGMTLNKSATYVEIFLENMWDTFTRSTLSHFLKDYYTFYDKIMQDFAKKRARLFPIEKFGTKRKKRAEEGNIPDSPEPEPELEEFTTRIEKVRASHCQSNTMPPCTANIHTTNSRRTSNTSATTPISILSRPSKDKKTKKTVRFDTNLADKTRENTSGKEYTQVNHPPELKPQPNSAFKQSSIPAELMLHSRGFAK